MIMASATPLKDIDEQFLQCLICLDRLKEPKLLPCLHRYCRDCLKKIVKKEDKKVQCPTCRGKHDLPEEGVDGLKTDFNTKNIVEFIELQDSVKHDPLKVCIHCSKKLKVEAFCFKCNDFLCQKCHEHHMTNRVMTDHQPHIFSLNEAEAKNLTIEKLSSLKQPPRCHNHPEKLSELCCATCGNLPICMPCTYGAHRGHDLQEVTSLAKVERAKLTERAADLRQYKDKIYRMQEEITNTKGKLIQTVGEKKHKLQEQLDVEEKKLKTAIRDTDERLKQREKEIEENLKRKMSSKKQELEKKMKEARENYDRVCAEERREADAEFKKLQEESERVKIKLEKGLDSINKEIKDLLTSLKTQEEENTKKINELSDHFEDIVKQFKNVTATASSILAAKHPWTDVQCIPDICRAVDRLIAEVKREFPELKTLSDITVGVLSLVTIGRGVKVNITEREESVVNVTGVIMGITGCKDGSIIITGCTGQSGQSYIRVMDMKGEQLRQDIIKTSPSYQYRFCDRISQFKVATVCTTPNEIGIYDIRDGTYRSTSISDVSSWPAGRHVSCVAADTDHNHILVGGQQSRDVYVFNDQLEYIRTLVLPQMINWPRDMTVYKGNLLICDDMGRKTWAVTMGGREAKMVFEITKPKLDGADWQPKSVCTDRNSFIYLLWQGSGRILTQYSQDGRELLSTRQVDNDALFITTAEKDREEKMMIATFSTTKLYTYGLIAE